MKQWCYIALISAIFIFKQVCAEVEVRQQEKTTQATTSLVDKKFIQQALQEIKEELAQDQSKVFRIKREYQLGVGHIPLSVSTKIDYCGYRQQSTSHKKNLSSGAVNQTVQVIYKPTSDSNKLLLIARNASGRSHQQTIDISAVTCA